MSYFKLIVGYMAHNQKGSEGLDHLNNLSWIHDLLAFLLTSAFMYDMWLHTLKYCVWLRFSYLLLLKLGTGKYINCYYPKKSARWACGGPGCSDRKWLESDCRKGTCITSWGRGHGGSSGHVCICLSFVLMFFNQIEMYFLQVKLWLDRSL